MINIKTLKLYFDLRSSKKQYKPSITPNRTNRPNFLLLTQQGHVLCHFYICSYVFRWIPFSMHISHCNCFQGNSNVSVFSTILSHHLTKCWQNECSINLMQLIRCPPRTFKTSLTMFSKWVFICSWSQWPCSKIKK